MVASDKLKAVRVKLDATDAKDAELDERVRLAELAELRKRIQRAVKNKEYSATVDKALTATGSTDLMRDILDCGKWDNGNLNECESLYCARKGHRKNGDAKSCYKRTTAEQDTLMNGVLERYDNDDTELRKNLRSVTILFAVYGFDLDKNDNPIFPLYLDIDRTNPRATGTLSGTVIKARDKARGQLKKLKNKFKNVVWLGGYSWEIQHLDKLGLKKSASIDDLIGHSSSPKDGLVSDCQKILRTKAQDKWNKHYINFHCHLVVDLRGADGDDFTKFCHTIWGSVDNTARPVRDGVLVKRLVKDEYKSVPESLSTLAQYPFRNQWSYKSDYDGTDDDGHRDDIVDNDDTLEPKILSALINGTTLLNRKIDIVLNNKWDK